MCKRNLQRNQREKNPHTQEDSYNLEALLYAGMGFLFSISSMLLDQVFLKTNTMCKKNLQKKQKESLTS
jgi:hypothetical protein